MTDFETKILRQELEELRSQLAELKATQSRDRADFVKAFNDLEGNCFRSIEDIKAAQNIDREEAIKAIGKVHTESCEDDKAIYRHIADINDLLWPVMHKIFPQFAETKKQIDAILKRHR